MTSTVGQSRRLRESFEPVLPELFAATSAVVMHPQFRMLYPEFMMAVHQMVRATVPLMKAALARCHELADTDPLAAAMVPYFAHHIEEEMHHDDWLLEDLEAIGIPRAAVLRRMPLSPVASLIGAHYYWIHHHHPIAKLGQIAVMEGYPPSVESIDLMVARTGYPRRAFRTIEKHGHLDSHHRDEFNEALDAMPLLEEHFAILEISALHTVRAATRVYRELVRKFDDAQREAGMMPATGPVMPAQRPRLVTRRAGNEGQYRIEDADRAASYQIGEQEYFLLAHCDGRTSTSAVRNAFAERFGQPITPAELDEFLNTMNEEQLVGIGGESSSKSGDGNGAALHR